MNRIAALSLLLLLTGIVAPEKVEAQHIGVGARAGTLGPGLEVTVGVAPGLNLRAGANYFSYAHSDIMRDMEVDIRYNAELLLSSYRLLLDWHPFHNFLRLSAGIIYNNNGIQVAVTPVDSYTIQGKTFPPEKIGTLSAEIDYQSKINPYVGLGIGNAVSNRIGIAIDLGVLYTGSPAVAMEGTGMIAPTAQQAPDLEEGFSSFKFYPLLSLGLTVGI